MLGSGHVRSTCSVESDSVLRSVGVAVASAPEAVASQGSVHRALDGRPREYGIGLSDAERLYFQAIARRPLLSADEEVALARRASGGDERARAGRCPAGAQTYTLLAVT